MRRGSAALTLLGLSCAGLAQAAPPDEIDPALRPWFRSLEVPGTGTGCCSEADCRAADSRIVGGGYEVFVGGQWRPVPADLILKRTDNPTGRAVVCWTPTATSRSQCEDSA